MRRRPFPEGPSVKLDQVEQRVRNWDTREKKPVLLMHKNRKKNEKLEPGLGTQRNGDRKPW